MTPEDVINKWLVPSTAYKHNKRTSEHGRIMQGRKGIGRYAASILGNDFEMITTDKNGVQTTLSLDWNKLADVEYLDQIKIPINTRKTDSTSGTKLIIHSQLSENDYWDEDAIRKLRFELKIIKMSRYIPTHLINQKMLSLYDDYFTNCLNLHQRAVLNHLLVKR